jgi:hypothetical protein
LLKVENNKISCRLNHSTIQSVVFLSGTGQNGECSSGGRIQIMKLRVNNQDIIQFGESMLLYYSSTPTILSINIESHKGELASTICKGKWNWGNSYEDIKCDKKIIPRHK